MQRRSFAEVATGAVVLLVAAGFLLFAVSGSGLSMKSEGLILTARFDRVDGLNPGADVRIAGVKVGSVAEQRIDPRSFLAVLTLRIDPALRLPADSSAEITSEGLLGGRYVALVPGGSDRVLQNGQEITITQSAVSLESLLGRFIFSVTELNNQRQQETQGARNEPAAQTPTPQTPTPQIPTPPTPAPRTPAPQTPQR